MSDKAAAKSSLGGATEPPKEGGVAEALKPSSQEAEEALDATERRRDLGLPEDAPEEVVEAAEAKIADREDPDGDEQEATVLNFLLGPTVALEFDVDALIDTPTGREELTFHFKQLDDTRIKELEDEWTEGEGPFGRVNRLMLNAAKVAEATLYLADKDGRKVEINSSEFRGPIPNPIDAVRGRFKFQPGILSSVAQEIDAAAGMMNNRVGQARRAAPATDKTIATAVGNS